MPLKSYRLLMLLLAFGLLGPMQSFGQATVTKPTTDTKKKPPARVFSKVPLVRMWFSMDETGVMNYMTDLMEEYEVESSFVSGQLRAGRRIASEPPELQGMMVFMAKGLIPAAVQMQFRTVKDRAEFKDAIFKVKTQLGAAAELSGSGDHYQLDLDFSKGIPVFGAGEEGDDETEPKMINFPGMDQIQNNPAALASMKQTMHFRLVENVMWQGNMPEIMDFKFPTYEQLQPRNSARKYDLYGEFNIEEIPAYIKTMLFSAVNVTAKSKMQQRDEEDPVDYAARRANGDMWLELLRTIVYDVDKGRFSVQLAKDDKPIQVRLDLEARTESNFAKVGRTIGNVGTRFAAIRNRKAPLTLATNWGMPGQVRSVLTSTLALAQRGWQSELAGNEKVLSAANRMGQLLTETIDAGRTDVTFQLTGDVLTGFAVVGGVRLEQADEFREALDQFVSNTSELKLVEHSTDSDGNKYVTIGTGEVPIPGTDGVEFESVLNFTTYDSCLWFSYGGPSAQALLEDTIAFAKTSRQSESRLSPSFQFVFDLSEWMKGEDEAEGFNQYPRQVLVTAERKMNEGLLAMQSVLSGGEPKWPEETPARSSFLEKALERGGDEIDLRIDVNEKGVDLDLDIGLGVANMLMARMLDAQGKIMDSMMNNKSGKFNIPNNRRGGPPADLPTTKAVD
ncbi:MAG: hypothetical protein AB8G99_07860 [Planctomycetaceae bacterium]